MRKGILILIAASVAGAQTPAPAPPDSVTARGSISGVVRVEGVGTPVADADVRATRPGGKPATGKTDSEGRYSLRLLEPGTYQVTASSPPADGVPFGVQTTRPVVLQGDQELTGMDIRLALTGRISGKVVDENGEPLAGISVALVAREYTFGALRYLFTGGSTTDDQGKYSVGRVAPGRGYLLLARKTQMRLPAISNAPDDPKLRRPVPVSTYYPDSRTPEGGELLTLRVAEVREGIDIRMRKSPSYCVDGVLSGGTGSADLSFQIALQRPTSGASGNGATYFAMPGGKPGPDGKVRICDLHPADYEVTLSQYPAGAGLGGPDYMATANVAITDRDVSNLRVTALPKIAVPGEVVWDGTPPEKPQDITLNINMRSVTRTIYPSTKTSVPGQFSFDGLVMDDYSADFRGLPRGLYLKDVTYGGHSVLNKTIRPGSATSDAGIRIIVGQNGAFLTSRVADKSGNPQGAAYVLVFPANVSSEADLAAFLQTGVTDQAGNWTSGTLAPGKYYALASIAAIDKSPETIAKLWRAKNRAEEVELQPNGTARVSLEIKGIE